MKLMRALLPTIHTGFSNLVSAFKPTKKLTEEQVKLIPFRDKAQNILSTQGVSKRDVKVEILHPSQEDGMAIAFSCKGTENKEEAKKSQLAVEKAVLEILKEIPSELGTRFFLQVGPKPFSRCLSMVVTAGKVDYCDVYV